MPIPLNTWVFDPLLWALVLDAVVNMLGDPVVQGILGGALFTTVKTILREGLTYGS